MKLRNRDVAASSGLKWKLYCSSKSIVVKASTQNPAKVNGFPADAAAKFHAINTDNGVLSLAQCERRADSGSSDLSILSTGDDEGGGTGMKKLDHFYDGKLAEDGLTFRQNFIIRSYEIDRGRRAFFESLMNFSQEVNINHLKRSGLMVCDFGVTSEMRRRNLIWVHSRMQATVDCYPSWGDIIQAENQISLLKNSMHFVCLFSDGKTGNARARASSFVVMINKHTRKLSKLIDAARAELEPFCGRYDPILDKSCGKLQKLEEDRADYIRRGLMPDWSDLDVNQHVNNVKFIGWILEGTPAPMRRSHDLCAMTVEYRKECGIENKLESLSAATNRGGMCYDFDHLLRLEDGTEIARAKTTWRPKGEESGSVGFHII